jgi:UPF0271 protein
MELDLNADLGEGAGSDAELMALITSANICCGLHAGGPAEIAATLEEAARHGVAVGAHPGYADRANFGRLDCTLADKDLAALVLYQLAALEAMAREHGLKMSYLKPHGALYNQACRERRIADALIRAAKPFQLPMVGLPDSQLEAACRDQLPFVPEGFADRRYRADGSLVPRSDPGAFVHDPEEAVRQVEWLMAEKRIRTICLHGDNPEAVAFATAIRKRLLNRGVMLKAFSGD